MKWIPYIIVWVKKLDELRKILLVDLLIMKQVTSKLHIATPYEFNRDGCESTKHTILRDPEPCYCKSVC